MPKLYLENGAVIEGSIDEIADLAKKLDCGEVADGYRKISGREPKVGDFVKFSHDRIDIVAGKYYKIIAIDDNGDFTFTDDVGDIRTVSYGDEYVEFYEKVNADANEAITADAEPEFKVGDYVVALPDADHEYGITNTDMKLGKIIEVSNHEIIRIEIVAHIDESNIGDRYSVSQKYFRRATQEEVDTVLQQNVGFKIGDYVKLSIPDGKMPHFGWGDVKNGDVGKVVSVSGFKVVVDFPKQKEWNAKPEELIKLTAREVPFAKAGRKLDEFKVGDIVRIIDSNACPNGLKGYDGLITEIDAIKDWSLPFHVIKPSFVENSVNTWLRASQIELITPVENRVDR